MYFTILSSVYATDTCSSKKPTSPETAHEIVCTLHIFKTINESSDKSVD